mgnify:FL=1
MPELSRFFGIIIVMYPEIGGQHSRPHFHAKYQDDEVVISVDKIEILAGELPRKQSRLVIAWAEIHQEELKIDWDLLQKGKQPIKIKPLSR